MTVTLSIRNTDQHSQITITKVDYYETQGKLLVKHPDTALILGPLESSRYIVLEKDESGGSAVNVKVEWTADKLTNPPIVESIMIGTPMQQGVSFTSRSQVLADSEQ